MQAPIEYKIESPGGIENVIQVFRSVENVNHLIFCLPALGVRASYYLEMGLSIAQNGIHFAIMDWRGNGKSSVRPSYEIDFGYKELIEDLVLALDQLEKKFPDHKITILGHSLGGQIACLTMARYPDRIQKVIPIASCSVYHKGFGKKGWKIKLATKFIPTISNVFGHFPGKVLGFGGREAQQIMKDWSINGSTGLYQIKNDDFNYEAAMKECTNPITFISLEDDDMAPFEAVENLRHKFKDSDKIKHIMATAQDFNIPHLNHFNWVKHPSFLHPIFKKEMLDS